MALASERSTPDVVFHLAGGGLVMTSVQRPLEDFRKSVLSTAEILEWIKSSAPGVRLIFASSAAVYGEAHAGPIREDALISPCSPYGYHKRMSELLIESYAKRFGIAASVVRLFSVYGDGLRKQLLWDLCVRYSSFPASIQLEGTGYESRDWLWVEDAVRYLTLSSSFAVSPPFLVNGGTGVAATVRQVAEAVGREWGSACEIQFSRRTRPGDPSSLVANMEQGLHYGFIPEIDWIEGVRRYVRWFRQIGTVE
jgi:UDP-glucose 4-epimerase